MEQAYLVLTERCNLACSHCIRESSPYRKETSETEMMLSAIKQIHQDFPHTLVSLTGGEPTIYKGFDNLLNQCLLNGLNVSINSNGITSFFKLEKLKKWRLFENLSIQISLDGTEEYHDLIRGLGTYKKALNTIKILKDLGITCSVSATVINMNFFKSIKLFLNDLEPLGLAHIAIKRATYAGRASHGMEIDTLSWNRMVYKIREFKTQTQIKMSPMFDFSQLDKIDFSIIEKIETPKSVNCGAGTNKFYIYPNGDLCGCTCFKKQPIGNIYQNSIKEILAEGQTITVRHPVCIKCKYFRLCKGGCLGSGYQHSGILGTPDPRCPKITKMK